MDKVQFLQAGRQPQRHYKIHGKKPMSFNPLYTLEDGPKNRQPGTHCQQTSTGHMISVPSKMSRALYPYALQSVRIMIPRTQCELEDLVELK